MNTLRTILNPVPMLALSLALAVLTGCETGRVGPNDTHTIAMTTVHDPVLGRPTLGMPLAIPGHHTRLVPFSVETTKNMFERDDPYARGGGRAARSVTAYSVHQRASGTGLLASGSVRWHNALLLDPATGASRVLLGDKAVISSWAAFGSPQTSSNPEPATDLLLFRVTGDDTDHDGELTGLDASRVVVCEPDGTGVRVISPRDGQVWSIDYDPALKTLYLEVVRDNSGDGRFTYNDTPELYAWTLGQSGPATRIVSDDTLRELQSILNGAARPSGRW